MKTAGDARMKLPVTDKDSNYLTKENIASNCNSMLVPLHPSINARCNIKLYYKGFHIH